MPKLYEIADIINQHLVLDDLMLPDDIKTELENMPMIFTEKVLNIARLVKNWSTEAEACNAEEIRLHDRKKALQGKIEALKEYCKDNMIKVDMPIIKDELFTVSVRNNPISCEVENVMFLPEQYRKIEWIPLKADIIKHFKDTGEIVTGAKIITDKTRLEIK